MAFATAPRLGLTKKVKKPKPIGRFVPQRITGGHVAPGNAKAKPNAPKPYKPPGMYDPRGRPPVHGTGPRPVVPPVGTQKPPHNGNQPPTQATLPGGAENKMPLESLEGATMRQQARDTYGFDLPDINHELLMAALGYGGAPTVEQEGWTYDPATRRAIDNSYLTSVNQDPNSVIANIGRDFTTKTRGIQEGMNDAGSFYSGAHQFAQGELESDIGRQRLKAKNDFDQAMYTLHRRLMQARYGRDTQLGGATQKDIEAELARPREPREDPKGTAKKDPVTSKIGMTKPTDKKSPTTSKTNMNKPGSSKPPLKPHEKNKKKKPAKNNTFKVGKFAPKTRKG
jgi:hypothetical protein